MKQWENQIQARENAGNQITIKLSLCIWAVVGESFVQPTQTKSIVKQNHAEQF